MRRAQEIRSQTAGSDDDDLDLTPADCEMVLSREEFEMLQAFHRFVPLPALTSRILHIYCEDDLQVPEAPSDDSTEDVEANRPSPVVLGRENASNHSSTISNILRHPCRPSNLRKKPHYSINLTSQTPRIQQEQPSASRPPSSSRSSTDSERSERPDSQN